MKSPAVGLKKNMKKGKVMLKRHAESFLTFCLGREILQGLTECSYFKQVVSADTNHEKEIRSRINMGWGALGKYSEAKQRKGIQPVSTTGDAYGADTWGDLLNTLKENLFRRSEPWKKLLQQ